MLKVGLIGVGRMGKNHLRILGQMDKKKEIELVGVHDKDWLLAEIHTKRYGSFPMKLSELLDKADAIFICTPTETHYEMARVSLVNNCHVFVEKPITDNLSKAHKLREIASAKEKMVTVGHIERFNPVVKELTKIITSKDIISIGIKRIGPVPPARENTNVIMELSIHDIDLISFITKSPINRIQSLKKDNHSAILTFTTYSGIMVYTVANWLTPYKERKIEITCDHSYIIADLISQKITEYSDYEAEDSSYIVSEISVPYGEPLKLEIESFLNSIQNNEPLEVNINDGINVLEIAQTCLIK